MKKKLLTVLLAIVMVFGVFSLTACGGANPDDEYNYYASKYEITGEIKIEPVNYFGVEKMFTTAGTFLLYIDNEDNGAKERFTQMNKLANDWGVTVHHFNPDIGGGYAATDTMARVIDLTKDLSQDEIVGGSSFVAMQQELITLLKLKNTNVVSNHYFVSIKGAAPHIQDNPNYIAVGVNEKDLHDQNYKPELYKNADGYGTYGDNIVGHIFDISKNVDGSARAEKYDYEGKTWQEIHANCYDVTEDGYERNRARYGGAITANNNYAANDAYIYHVMPKAYAHSIGKGVSLNAQNADPADAIRAVAWKKPSYAKYADDKGVIGPDGYLTQNINTFNMYGDHRLHMAGDYDTATSDYIGEKQDVYHLIANYGQFEWLLNHNEGSFQVYFGGPWCPNSQAVMKVTNEVAKDYGIKKIYVFDPRLDGGVRTYGYAMAAKRSVDKDGNQILNEDGSIKFEFNPMPYGGRPYEHLLSRNADFIQSDINEGKKSVLGSEMYGANFLYANFVENYLTDYVSYWKLSRINIDRNGNGTYEANENFTEMSVPNLMAFNGEGEGKAKLLAWAEAEYHWNFISTEGNAKREAWIAEIKHVYDQNPYVSYNPIPVIPDTKDDASSNNSSSSASSSSSSNSAADSSGGGC